MGEGADRQLVAGVDIGPLVPVDFNRNKMFVDETGDLFIFITFPVNDMAPMAPRSADIEEDRTVDSLGLLESLRGPREPLDGLVGCPFQVRTPLFNEPIRKLRASQTYCILACFSQARKD